MTMALLLKNLAFTVIIPGTVGVYVPLLIAETRPHATGAAGAIALVLLVFGSSIYAWCVWDFATFGRGTPAPIDAPQRLVVRGLYRYSRNPMYVGVLSVILGWAALFQSSVLAVYALIVVLCFHLFIVPYEEPHLRRQFGKEYDDYRARTGRWLPKVRRPSA
jgi:protein-S-isoprenylcysteine O-methyltransferase Ste14